MAPDLSRFDRLSDFDVAQRSYRTEDEARACVRELQQDGVDVLVATPGRLLDLVHSNALRLIADAHGTVYASTEDEIASVGAISAADPEIGEKIADEFIHPKPPGHFLVMMETAKAFGLTEDEVFTSSMLSEFRGKIDFMRAVVYEGTAAEWYSAVTTVSSGIMLVPCALWART